MKRQALVGDLMTMLTTCKTGYISVYSQYVTNSLLIQQRKVALC